MIVIVAAATLEGIHAKVDMMNHVLQLINVLQEFHVQVLQAFIVVVEVTIVTLVKYVLKDGIAVRQDLILVDMVVTLAINNIENECESIHFSFILWYNKK